MDKVNGRLWLKELCKRTNRTQHFHYAFFRKNTVYEPLSYEPPRKQENFKIVQSDAFNGLKKKPQKLIIRTLR